MTTRQPVVHDDILDPNSIDHVTVISEGIRNDLKMCLQQALEYLDTGEHDGGWVIFKTINIESVLDLAQTVVDCCCNHLPKDDGRAA
jgi:hypothetical protein